MLGRDKTGREAKKRVWVPASAEDYEEIRETLRRKAEVLAASGGKVTLDHNGNVKEAKKDGRNGNGRG